MNPMSLLTKGSTLKGMKERPGRYKLLGSSVLPKFSSPKNPFPTTPHAEPEKAQQALFEQPKPAPEPRKEEGRPGAVKASAFVETSAFAKAAAARMAEKTKKVETEPTKPVSMAPAHDQASKPGLWSHLAVIPTGWADKWIPWRKTPPFPSATFQTELALEKIKVMRNDLSEDDLEVVMIEKKAGKKADKKAQSEKVEREKLTAYS
jgi:hypothetical protein